MEAHTSNAIKTVYIQGHTAAVIVTMLETENDTCIQTVDSLYSL